MKLIRCLALLLCAALLLSAAAFAAPEGGGYIVKLRGGTRLRGANALQPIAHAASYYTVQTLDELQPYLDAGLVESCDENVRVELFDDPAPLTNDPSVGRQWYLDSIHAAALWESGLDGSGVTVALIDSGVADTHEDLRGASITGLNFCGGITDGVLQYADRWQDTNQNGHGTAVTGILTARRNNGVGIAGMLEGVNILSLRCFSPNNSAPENERGGYVETIISAVGYAMEQGVDVINMSLGVRQEVAALESILREASDAGILLVASAGNYGTSAPYATVYPASYDFVVSVAATDADGVVMSLSQKNDQVTVAAPGSAILSTVNTGGYSELNGTSMASPIVAALAAAVKQRDGAIDGQGFTELLRRSAIDRGAPGKDKSYGWGSVDCETLLAALDADYAVRYETDGGTLPDGYLTSYRIARDTGAALPAPVRGGDAFCGWYLDEALTKGPYTALPAGCAGDVTLWADWARTLSGDVSGDGAVDMRDLLTLRQRFADGTAATAGLNADVDRDGTITMRDVLMLRQYLAGGYGVVLQ